MSFSEINYRHGVNLVDIDPSGEAQVEQIDYEPLRKLQTIPAKGRAASVEDVFKEIESLPQRKDKDNGDTWPYLEIHIEEKQPEPTLMHDVMLALQDKAVHFCRITRVRSEKIDEKSEKDALETDTLSAINPLDLAQSFFKKRYDADMPEPLLERFRQASQTEA